MIAQFMSFYKPGVTRGLTLPVSEFFYRLLQLWGIQLQPGIAPISKRPYWMPPNELAKLKIQLQDCNTRFIKGHKPSNHIRARIKSHIYTTE